MSIYCNVYVISQVIKKHNFVLNIDCESVHVLNISALSDTFPQYGNSPLHDAAMNGHLDTVKLLLRQGANLFLCNKVSVIVNW